MSALHRSGENEGGYTLIEMLISATVLALVLGAAYGLLFHGQQVTQTTMGKMTVRQRARVALNELVSDLQVAGYNLENTSQVIQEAKTDALTFVGDIDDGDPDGACTDEVGSDRGVERVSYRVLHGVLERRVQCRVDTAWTVGLDYHPVVTDVRSDQPLFRYYNAGGAELSPGSTGLSSTEREQVVAIQIALDIENVARESLVGEDAHPRTALIDRVRLPNASLPGTNDGNVCGAPGDGDSDDGFNCSCDDGDDDDGDGVDDDYDECSDD